MFRTALMSACLVLGLGSMSLGQVTLEQKFREGTSYATETNARISQKLTIAGAEIDTSNDVKSTGKVTVGKRDPEGKLRVQEKVDSLQVTMSVMGMNYQFDSTNPDNKGGSPLEILRDIHKAISGRTSTVVYDKSNRAVAVESDQDILGTLSPELQSLAKSQLDPTHLKNVANEELDQVKSEPINKGDQWQRTRSVNFGGGQVMTFQTEYTFAGTVENDGRTLDKVTSKTTSVNFGLEDSPLPFTLKSSDLKAVESEGVILFDRERGGAVETSSSVRVTGDITFVANNMDLPAKLDLKMETSTIVKP